MTVLTHTRPSAVEADLTTLDEDTQLRVRQLMQDADDTHSIDTRRALHTAAAAHLGIPLPTSGELALCTCTACYCDLVFDAWLARTYLDGTTERTQCPRCADEHHHGIE